MPRKKATASIPEEPISAAPPADLPPQAPAAPETPANGAQSPATAERIYQELPDPHELKIITLGSSNADPKMHLLRSHRYKQMQIRFDRDPDDKYKEMLRKEGWKDRTEEEGIWTKQLPKEGEKWRAAADAERLFKRIANDIRADKGLGAVMSL